MFSCNFFFCAKYEKKLFFEVFTGENYLDDFFVSFFFCDHRIRIDDTKKKMLTK
jgi:hypothetical protein